MPDFDVSSYPKPQPQPSGLQIAQQIGAVQQQNLGISQAKLDQANQALNYMTRAFGSLPPDAGKEDYLKVGQNVVDMGLVPQAMLQTYTQRLEAAPTAQAFRNEFLGAAASHQEQIQNYNGNATSINNGAQVIPGMQSGPLSSNPGAFTPSGTSLPVQPPPTTPINLPDNQPGIIGAQPPIVAPSRPGGLPVAPQNNAPVAPARQPRPLSSLTTAPARSGPTGPTVQTAGPGTTQESPNFSQRFSAAYPAAGGPIATGPIPGAAEAQKAVGLQSGTDYAADLTRAKNYQADLYPMQKVLDIVKEEGPQAFGPGTSQLTNLKSAIVTWGGPSVDQKTIDNVSNVEQAKKYLVQMARSSGSTGTNDQLAAAFEANPNTTMSGATIENVVKSNIALRKMQMGQTLLFGQQKDAAGNTLPDSEYSKWISKNQNVLDPRAFGFDMMDDKAKNKLVDSMATKDNAGNWIAKKGKEKEFIKFDKSLRFAHDADLISPGAK